MENNQFSKIAVIFMIIWHQGLVGDHLPILVGNRIVDEECYQSEEEVKHTFSSFFSSGHRWGQKQSRDNKRSTGSL
jgi:hypothetical protein